MQTHQIPWKDRLYLSIPDTASIFARSPSWVRDRATEGRLELVSIAKGGPSVVTVASVSALIDQLDRERRPITRPAMPGGPWPQLIWINPHTHA